jgi:arginyl-tRNA synthetase
MQSLGLEAQMPEEGYLGQYIIALGEELARENGDKFIKGDPDTLNNLAEICMEKMLDNIKTDLSEVKVEFDLWFSEQSLFKEKIYDQAINLLKENGHTAEREEALWFTGSLLGDSRDSVLIRRTGAPTYFASDIAYHYDKFVNRKFDRVINIWGADHQGHVPRMNAVMQALGVDKNKLEFILVQLVTLKKEGTSLRVSKRTGDLLTLSEVVEEVGADSCRYFFLSRSPDSQMDFDMDLAKKEAPENPVYYIQYAYARIASILRDIPIDLIENGSSNGKLLVEPEEENLIRQMVRFTEIIESSTKTLEPHHLAHYTLSLASDFHEFYAKHRVLGIEKDLSLARIDLIKATQIVLRNALNLMGMTIPEKM